jgi:flagellar biogenesis protein FliO
MRAMTASRQTEAYTSAPRLLLERVFTALLRIFVAQRDGEGNALRIESKLSLGPKKTLFLIGCGERQFLVAAGAETVVSLGEVLQESVTGRRKARVRQHQEGEQ